MKTIGHTLDVARGFESGNIREKVYSVQRKVGEVAELV